MSNAMIYDKQALSETATVNSSLTVQKEGEHKVLSNASSIFQFQSQTKTLDPVEKDYLKTIQALESQAKKESRKP